MANIYTVSQVNSYIRHLFEEDFALGAIRIKGEVSNCKYHSSGHIYFTLKDEKSSMAAVMFAGNRSGLQFPMKDGDRVTAFGSVNVYERDGKYQLYAREIIQDGIGDLYQRFEQLKKELLEMGMFDAVYKKPLPRYAQKVGIITSPTGAAIRDIINIATRRNPYVQLYLCPALVQGAEAVPSLISGLNRMDAMGMDVLIIGRGGGSIEDLWAFNEEEVARAIFACKTPVISAVGHETDVTISDYVADMRAPTPSAAAELAVFDYQKFLENVGQFRTTLDRTMMNRYQLCRAKFQYLAARMEKISPVKQLLDQRQQLDYQSDRLKAAMDTKLQFEKHRLKLAAEMLHGLSPMRKLESGFSYVSNEKGQNIRRVEQVKKGEQLQITLCDGELKAKVLEVKHGREDDN